jgi:hypothetical protein
MPRVIRIETFDHGEFTFDTCTGHILACPGSGHNVCDNHRMPCILPKGPFLIGYGERTWDRKAMTIHDRFLHEIDHHIEEDHHHHPVCPTPTVYPVCAPTVYPGPKTPVERLIALLQALA